MTAAAPVRRALSRVAIVGRSNVGKSTLLNRLCGSRVAIVEPTAGVTRDRVAVPARLRVETPAGVSERWVEMIDTGGMGIVDRDDLGAVVEAQVQMAIDSAELVLFVVDARDGLGSGARLTPTQGLALHGGSLSLLRVACSADPCGPRQSPARRLALCPRSAHGLCFK